MDRVPQIVAGVMIAMSLAAFAILGSVLVYRIQKTFRPYHTYTSYWAWCRYHTLRERVRRYTQPRLHRYFERRLAKNAIVVENDTTFTFEAVTRLLWIKRERTFRTAVIHRIELTEVWFVELQTIYGGELVRNARYELFHTYDVAREIARGAVAGTLLSRAEHYGSDAAYGTHWSYYRSAKPEAGFYKDTFTMRHPASPDGGPLAYLTVMAHPAKGVFRHGAWGPNDQMVKNKPQVCHIDKLCSELNKAISAEEQALAKR